MDTRYLSARATRQQRSCAETRAELDRLLDKNEDGKYDRLMLQLGTKLKRQQQALELTRLHLDALGQADPAQTDLTSEIEKTAPPPKRGGRRD